MDHTKLLEQEPTMAATPVDSSTLPAGKDNIAPSSETEIANQIVNTEAVVDGTSDTAKTQQAVPSDESNINTVKHRKIKTLKGMPRSQIKIPDEHYDTREQRLREEAEKGERERGKTKTIWPAPEEYWGEMDFDGSELTKKKPTIDPKISEDCATAIQRLTAESLAAAVKAAHPAVPDADTRSQMEDSEESDADEESVVESGATKNTTKDGSTMGAGQEAERTHEEVNTVEGLMDGMFAADKKAATTAAANVPAFNFSHTLPPAPPNTLKFNPVDSFNFGTTIVPGVKAASKQKMVSFQEVASNQGMTSNPEMASPNYDMLPSTPSHTGMTGSFSHVRVPQTYEEFAELRKANLAKSGQPQFGQTTELGNSNSSTYLGITKKNLTTLRSFGRYTGISSFPSGETSKNCSFAGPVKPSPSPYPSSFGFHPATSTTIVDRQAPSQSPLFNPHSISGKFENRIGGTGFQGYRSGNNSTSTRHSSLTSGYYGREAYERERTGVENHEPIMSSMMEKIALDDAEAEIKAADAEHNTQFYGHADDPHTMVPYSERLESTWRRGSSDIDDDRSVVSGHDEGTLSDAEDASIIDGSLQDSVPDSSHGGLLMDKLKIADDEDTLLNDLRSYVQELEAKNSKLEEENSALKSENCELKGNGSDNVTMDGEQDTELENNRGKNSEIGDWKDDLIGELRDENEKLHEKVLGLETKVSELETKSSDLETKNSDLDVKNAELDTNLKEAMLVLADVVGDIEDEGKVEKESEENEGTD